MYFSVDLSSVHIQCLCKKCCKYTNVANSHFSIIQKSAVPNNVRKKDKKSLYLVCEYIVLFSCVLLALGVVWVRCVRWFRSPRSFSCVGVFDPCWSWCRMLCPRCSSDACYWSLQGEIIVSLFNLYGIASALCEISLFIGITLHIVHFPINRFSLMSYSDFLNTYLHFIVIGMLLIFRYFI